MPTLQEIIDFKPVGKGDGYDITTAMNEDAEADENQTHYADYRLYEGDQITMDHVVDVMYDSRRGAQTSVLRFNTVPFAVITRAGRELGDTGSTFIIDAEYAAKALAHWAPQPEFKDVYNKEAHIALAYWEGTEVELGDEGHMEVFL